MGSPQERDGIPALVSGRATVEAALALNPPVRVLRVLLVVVADTALWSRFEAPVTHKRIKDLTGMTQREVSKAFAWLRQHDLLGYQPGYSLPNGPRSSSIVTLTMGREEPRSERPTVRKGRDRGPTRSSTVGRGGPPFEDPSGISRAGGASSAAAALERRIQDLRVQRERADDERDRQGLDEDIAALERQIGEEAA